MARNRNFADVYNLRRQEGVPSAASLPKIVLNARNWGSISKLRREVEQSARGDYKLVRSDLEEDAHKRELPHIPEQKRMLRQRTTALTHMVFNRRNQTVDTNECLPWVDSGVFHGVSGAMICVNAALIGLETETDTPAWFYIEQGLIIFFVFELVMRLIRHGWNFFKHDHEDCIWNFFDFFIVLSGVCDEWLIPVVMRMLPRGNEDDEDGASSTKQGKMSMFFMLMRMLRLLRIVRLFRLVRIVRPLYELAQGVLEALQGMFWVLCFLLISLYCVAIFCTRLIGQGGFAMPKDPTGDDLLALDEIIPLFATVQDSMFSLFGTMSSWSLLKFMPLFAEMPWLKPILVLFYVYSAWALLAIMTGVVSENMIAIRDHMAKEDALAEETRKTMITKLLIELFQHADEDHSGTVTRAEFDSLLRSADLARKIERNTHLKIKDLEELFDWLDHDGSGNITIDEFMQGFKWVNEPLRAKSLVKLQERLAVNLRSLEFSVSEAFSTRTEEVLKLVAAPLKKVHAITEQMQTMDVHFGGLRTRIRDFGLAMPSPQDLRDTEYRLNCKIATILQRLEEVEQAAIITARREEVEATLRQ